MNRNVCETKNFFFFLLSTTLLIGCSIDLNANININSDSTSQSGSEGGSGVYVYTAGYSDASLHLSSLNTTTGALTAVTSYSVTASPRSIARSSDGSCLWVASAGGTVHEYSVDSSDGTLTQVGTKTLTSPYTVYVHPTLSVLYVGYSQNIQSYTINSDCTLSALGAANSLAASHQVAGMSIVGDYLFTNVNGIGWDYTYVHSINAGTGALTAFDDALTHSQTTVAVVAREGTASNLFQAFALNWQGGFYQNNFDSSGPTLTGMVASRSVGLINNYKIFFGPDSRLYVPTRDYIWIGTLDASGAPTSSKSIDLPGAADTFGAGQVLFQSSSLVLITSINQDRLYSFDFTADTLTEIDSVSIGDNPAFGAELIEF